MRAGIDIGGTDIKIAVLDNKEIVKETILKNSFNGNPDKMVSSIIEKLNELNDINLLEFVGAGIPGAVREGIIYSAENLGIHEFKIEEEIRKYFHGRIKIDNDANCALIGEVQAGGLIGYKNAILLTLGTGVGGGILIDGKIYRGSTNSAGEFGHVIYKRNGRKCPCGKKGCFEQYASTNALIKQIRKGYKNNSASKIFELANNKLDKINGRIFFEAVKLKDEYALRILDSYTDYISDGIVDFYNIFDFEAVSIGGGISGAGELLIEPVRQKLKINGVNINITASKLGNKAGVIGAAYLA